MKVIILALTLLSSVSNAGVESSLSTIPSQPTADRQFTAEYQWIQQGCGSDYAVHEDGNQHTITVEADVVRIYLNSLSSYCWSPWIPTEVTQNYSLAGLNAGDYTLQLIMFVQSTQGPVSRLPTADDSQFLLAETQLIVGPAIQAVNLWSDSSIIILSFLMMLIGYLTLNRRTTQKPIQ